MFRSKITISALATCAAIMFSTAAAYAAPMTYYVDQTIDAAKVVGTITTDGTIGVLDTANITDFSLKISDGISSDTINPSNVTFTVYGDGFTATSTGLFFDYSLDSDAIVILGQTQQDSHSGLCYVVSDWSCIIGTTAETADLNDTMYSASPEGFQELASSTQVPEPSSLALLITGACSMAGVMRRRFSWTPSRA